MDEIYGLFNGVNMVTDDGKIYPVYENYASKSKLVEGDELKLIFEDGKMIFKQVSPAPRESYLAKVTFAGKSCIAVVDDRRYKLLHASVTYFRVKEGDEVIIIVPSDIDSEWAALESVIRKDQDQEM